MSALAELAGRLRSEGGLLGAAAVDPPPDAESRADLAVEAIREGELAHYGTPRVLDAADADLALLAGDRLYALGLAELARREDLDAIATLAQVIARCAQAHAEDRPQDADAAWAAADGL